MILKYYVISKEQVFLESETKGNVISDSQRGG